MRVNHLSNYLLVVMGFLIGCESKVNLGATDAAAFDASDSSSDAGLNWDASDVQSDAGAPPYAPSVVEWLQTAAQLAVPNEPMSSFQMSVASAGSEVFGFVAEGEVYMGGGRVRVDYPTVLLAKRISDQMPMEAFVGLSAEQEITLSALINNGSEVCAAGTYSGTLYLDSPVTGPIAPVANGFVVCYETRDGTQRSAHILKASGGGLSLTNLLHDGQNTYLVGSGGTLEGVDDAIVSDTKSGAFIIKFQSDGEGVDAFQYLRRFEGLFLPRDILLRGGKLYLGGTYGTGANVEPPSFDGMRFAAPIRSTGDLAIGLLAVDESDGRPLWTQSGNSPGQGTVDRISHMIFAGDALMVAGDSFGLLQFGSQLYETLDNFVAALDPTTGSVRWIVSPNTSRGRFGSPGMIGISVDENYLYAAIAPYGASICDDPLMDSQTAFVALSLVDGRCALVSSLSQTVRATSFAKTGNAWSLMGVFVREATILDMRTELVNSDFDAIAMARGR